MGGLKLNTKTAQDIQALFIALFSCHFSPADGLVRLRPVAESGASMPSMLLAIDTATALPASIRYELDDEAVDIAIRSVTRSETGPKAFDRRAFEGYEWIDFR